jgi:hypothetical protein
MEFLGGIKESGPVEALLKISFYPQITQMDADYNHKI